MCNANIIIIYLLPIQLQRRRRRRHVLSEKRYFIYIVVGYLIKDTIGGAVILWLWDSSTNIEHKAFYCDLIYVLITAYWGRKNPSWATENKYFFDRVISENDY